jgi:hypothetical protein
MQRSVRQPRSQPARFDTRPIILAAMVGALLEYVWDPQKGRSRRAVTRDQFWAAVHQARRRLGRFARFAEGEAFGVVEEAVIVHKPDNPNPDDATLRDRVESELFRDWTVPKGDININVAEGVVELRGQVERPEDIDEIEAKVRHVEGARVIHNYLHLPGTPAPNKARVLSIS